MDKLLFKDLNLSSEVINAIEDMGFKTTTEIQFKAIPLIKKGLDVIGKSQTGTGKTVAFGIPCVEAIDTKVKKGVQALILCPTRELAVQACEEINKIAKYKPNIKTADIYGGASIERQISKLKSANIVVGTPGRVMDHMRRRTLKLDNLKMIVLDEADEMLSMGFREDIETILTVTPLERQTILFSATMPSEILALTRKFQNNPQMVEVNRNQHTVSNISQCYYNVPMGRKMDALNLLLKFYNPKLSMIFCNTKKMVDDITDYLTKHKFSAQGLHGDMNQSQRTKVMNSFKSGKTNILVATDVAARGIDVNNIDYVINYDIPQNTEYYIHRIGRTGRAGKSGKAITICSGRHQSEIMSRLARLVKAKISLEEMPTIDDVLSKRYENELAEIKSNLSGPINDKYMQMASSLQKEGYPSEKIIAALLCMHFGEFNLDIDEVKSIKNSSAAKSVSYKKIIINIGRTKRVAPNHIVGAITESTVLSGKDIGKIEIFDDKTIVCVPEHALDDTIKQMKNCKICGTPTVTKIYKSKSPFDNSSSSKRNSSQNRTYNKGKRKRK